MNRMIKRLNKRRIRDDQSLGLPKKRFRKHVQRYGCSENNSKNYDDLFSHKGRDDLVTPISTQTKSVNVIGTEVQNSK